MLEARRRLHGYLSERPKDDDRLSWLALLRHFGVPTRLLDVTWSPFVAAYFATRDRTRRDADAAVWVFMSGCFHQGLLSWQRDASLGPIIEETPYGITQVANDFWPSTEGLPAPENPLSTDDLCYAGTDLLNPSAVQYNALLHRIRRPGTLMAEPHWMSRRLDAQQGAFLVPFSIRHSFESNLCAGLGLPSFELEQARSFAAQASSTEPDQHCVVAPVIKIRIPSSLKLRFENTLRVMNIHEHVLFPDLEGAMRHLSTFLDL